MAMVKRHGPIILLSLLLAGCDYFPGPTLTNGYGTDLTITVTYSNGRVSHGPWPVCRALLIGGDDRVHPTHVSIERDGTVLREFSADEIQTMEQKEDAAESPSEWFISPEGPNLLRREASVCAQKNKAE